jgi:Tfp pilus assembly protein PilN
MKAVNLIPDEQRRGAGGSTGRSGGVAYAIVGVLAGLVGLFALYTMANNKIDSRHHEIDALKQQVATAEQANNQLQQFSSLAARRVEVVQTVSQLANTRFPWAHALQEIARLLPSDVYIEEMDANASPTTTSPGAATGAPSQPNIELKGCTAIGHDEVARMMIALRLMDGVDDVTLATSVKGDGTDSGGGSASGGGCQVTNQWPQFDITVIYKLPGNALGSSTQKQVRRGKGYYEPASDTPAASLSGDTASSSTSAPASASAPASSPTPAANTGVGSG